MLGRLCKKKIRLVIDVMHKHLLGAYFLVTLLALSQGIALAWPGGFVRDGMPRKSRPKKVKTQECPTCEQIKELEEQVKELSQQLDANAAKPVEDLEARRQISELKAKLSSAEERAAAAERANEQLRTEANTLKASANSTNTKVASVAATQVATSSQVEVLTKKTDKIADNVTHIGPFRFGGDFRLRLDAILRSSFNNPAPGQTALQHVQNVRARYRLRFNFATDINPKLTFSGQISSGTVNNPLTFDQDFTAITTHQPFFVSEAYADFHPAKWISIQGGRLPEVFADNSRFLFDDDIRFNGFNQRFIKTFEEPFLGFSSIEGRAGQYIFSNPNVAIVTNANLGPTGAVIGSTGRAANLFHQGLLINQKIAGHFLQQFGGDIQVYRNPNQIQFASTPTGVPIIVQVGLGLTLSGPLTGTGNATTTNAGSIYTADNYYVARVTYQLNHPGIKIGDREFPISFNFQVARNVGTGLPQRDGLLTSFKFGSVRKAWDNSLLYVYAFKGANAIISQVTDDDLGTNTGVNIRTHHIRWDIGLFRGVQLQNLLFIQKELASSGQYPNFFVPLNAYTPRQFRLQQQIIFSF